jgi:hypothetical protein
MCSHSVARLRTQQALLAVVKNWSLGEIVQKLKILLKTKRIFNESKIKNKAIDNISI